MNHLPTSSRTQPAKTADVAVQTVSGASSSTISGGVELSVIVPAFNERENVVALLDRLRSVLQNVAWEVIYVDDDSPDGTADVVRACAQLDRRVRCIQRVGRRGLSSAVIEGILASSAPFVAVIDADLQHDESLLPRMLERITRDALDVVVGSRYVDGGGTGDWNDRRAAFSRFATRLSRVVVRQPLTDPMSGFFMISRPAFERAVHRLSGQGFKILLDLFASSPEPYRFAELPYTFRSRIHGESKLDKVVVWEYLMLLVDKRMGRVIPARFALFAAVGASGLVVHLIALGAFLYVMSFAAAQLAASVVAMITNFLVNNAFTYRDRRLRGVRLLTGLVTFVAVCSVGAIANVRFAIDAFDRDYSWWVSGIAGAIVGAVWNYSVSSLFTWRNR
jgi:dolichol-phosphate mannosyltransferase